MSSGWTQPRIVALAISGDEPGAIAAIVGIAAAVAAPIQATVEVIMLGTPSETELRAAVGAGGGILFACLHPDLHPPLDRDALVAAFALALSHPAVASPDRPILGLLPAGPAGEEIGGRLAVRLDGVALGRCLDIAIGHGGISLQRAGFGGRARLMMSFPAGLAFATMRPLAGTKAGEPSEAVVAALKTVAVSLEGDLPPKLPIARAASSDPAAKLDGARVIVSGGRGMAGPDGFALLQQVAASLGAAVGGSLPTVDAGWIPVTQQIGQSGKFVSPELYVAVGLSGTPQHMAGLGHHSRIVAINSDPEADIFRFAEIGLVGDWKVILPALLKELGVGKASSTAPSTIPPT